MIYTNTIPKIEMNLQQRVLVTYGFFSFFSLLFSPIIALFVGAFPLIILTEYINKIQRLFLSAIVVFALALIASASGASEIWLGDFANSYYPNFLSILNKGEGFFEYGAGVEIGLPSVHYLISLFGNVRPHVILFVYAASMLILLVAWLEKYGMSYIKKEDRSLIVVACLLLVSIGLTTLLARQMYSSILLLYAISISSNKRYFFLVLAGLFHVTAIPIYFLVRFVINSPFKGVIYTTLFSILFALFFDDIVNHWSKMFLPITLSNKFIFYSGVNLEELKGLGLDTWGILRRMIVILILPLYYLLFQKYRRIQSKQWAVAALSFSIIGLSVSNIHILPGRITLLFTAILFGYLIAIILIDSGYKRFLQIAISLWLARQIFNFYQDSWWYSFEVMGGIPLYYWL